MIPVILGLLSDGRERSAEQIREAVATHFGLTHEERTRTRGRGLMPEYSNENAWGLVELQRDGYIRKPDPRRLVYRLTDAGEEAAHGYSLGPPGSGPKRLSMSKRSDEMTAAELVWAIEGYARSARRSFDEGKDPWQTLSRARSMIDRYEREARKSGRR
jgi:DNA-binding PadR family transcriptional regulator